MAKTAKEFTNNQGEIIIYQTDDGDTKIDVPFIDETVWLTQQQMAELFQSSRSNIAEHIQHIYEEGELDEISTCRNFRQVRTEGNRQVTRTLPHYNLDMIISLGYRVKSLIATRFRRWATERLKEYMIKGFTMDDERMKNLGGGNYWKELLDRIRDIRSSEKVWKMPICRQSKPSEKQQKQMWANNECILPIENASHPSPTCRSPEIHLQSPHQKGTGDVNGISIIGTFFHFGNGISNRHTHKAKGKGTVAPQPHSYQRRRTAALPACPASALGSMGFPVSAVLFPAADKGGHCTGCLFPEAPQDFRLQVRYQYCPQCSGKHTAALPFPDSGISLYRI